MALTTRIKEYREMQDLKQSDLAELVGVRRETIVNLERGKYNPSLKLAIKTPTFSVPKLARRRLTTPEGCDILIKNFYGLYSIYISYEL